jgi:hypothetical protein
MAALDPHLMSIFEAIVDDYDGQPPERRERLWHVRTFGEEGSNEWDSNQPRVSRDDLDDLHDAGLIDVDYNSSGDYLVKPTREGRSSLREVRREQTLLERSDPVDLTWAAVRPVLHAAVDEWTERGAPRSGYVVLRAIARRLDRDSDELPRIARAVLPRNAVATHARLGAPGLGQGRRPAHRRPDRHPRRHRHEPGGTGARRAASAAMSTGTLQPGLRRQDAR